MAISSNDMVMAGMKAPAFFSKTNSPNFVAGRPYTPFYVAGFPGAAVAPTPGIAGAALTSYPGQLWVPPASNNTHLARFSGMTSSQGGILMLCDRLWHNSGIAVTTTTAQTVNSVAFPARDMFGATNGDGVQIGLEVSTITGAGAATPSISYTNQAGTAGRTATMLDPYVAASAVGTFYRMALAAGDTGVRSVQTYTGAVSMTSGAIHLVAYRILAMLELQAAGIGNAIDALTSGLPRLWDNTVPFLVYIPPSTGSNTITGQLICTQG